MILAKDDTSILSLLLKEDLYLIKEQRTYSAFEYEGENNKHILILSSEKISVEEKIIFEKIISALNLSLHDVSIVNLADYPGVSFSQLKNFFACKRMIAFGLKPAKIGIKQDVPLYEAGEYQSVKIIFSDRISMMAADEAKKKQFWNTLKKMFHA